MLCTGDNVLTQPSHINAAFFALMYLQLGLITRQQVMDLLIVQLRITQTCVSACPRKLQLRSGSETDTTEAAANW